MPLEKIEAPFSKEQVEALNRFQARPDFHEYTCGNDERHSGRHALLVATRDGWVCSDPECEYTQNWAHAFSVNPSTDAAN